MPKLMTLLVALVLPYTVSANTLPSNVIFEGELENPSTPRGQAQWAMINLMGIWANCNVDELAEMVTDDIDFSYPTTRYQGIDALRKDMLLFCGEGGSGVDTSFYLPKDAFYIDAPNGRIAAEVQFRSTVRGTKQVINDVWIGTMRDGKLSIVKEYLDGRVKDLQNPSLEGGPVLVYEESPEFMAPWPPRTEQWADCFPIVRAAPITSCPAK